MKPTFSEIKLQREAVKEHKFEKRCVELLLKNLGYSSRQIEELGDIGVSWFRNKSAFPFYLGTKYFRKQMSLIKFLTTPTKIPVWDVYLDLIDESDRDYTALIFNIPDYSKWVIHNFDHEITTGLIVHPYSHTGIVQSLNDFAQMILDKGFL